MPSVSQLSDVNIVFLFSPWNQKSSIHTHQLQPLWTCPSSPIRKWGSGPVMVSLLTEWWVGQRPCEQNDSMVHSDWALCSQKKKSLLLISGQITTPLDEWHQSQGLHKLPETKSPVLQADQLGGNTLCYICSSAAQFLLSSLGSNDNDASTAYPSVFSTTRSDPAKTASWERLREYQLILKGPHMILQNTFQGNFLKIRKGFVVCTLDSS